MYKKAAVVALSMLVLACQSKAIREDVNITAKNEGDGVQKVLATEPVAKKIPHTLVSHGDTRTDNYYWMRDDTRSDPQIIQHLEAENSYIDSQLRHTESLQASLFDEMTNRMKKDDASVPVKYKDYYYYRRFEGDKEYPIYARKKGALDTAEEILLDGNAMAESHSQEDGYFAIGGHFVSTNQNILAYSLDTVGRRIYTIAFKDLTTGKVYEERLEGTTGSIVWANDNETLFYIRRHPETLLGYQVYRHILGTRQDKDVLMYEETDGSFYTWLEKSKDDSTIMIVHSSTITQGASILDANTPKAEFKKFADLEPNHEYMVAKLDDWFYILTNWQAKNFRLMKVKQDQTSNKSAWREVIAHNDKVFLQDFDVFNKHIVLNEKEKGQNRIRILNLADKRSHVITFNDPVYVVALDNNISVDTNLVRINYSSLTTPVSIYDYDMNSRTKTLLKQDEVVGDFDPSQYTSERIFVAARDGKHVPVSIVYRNEYFKKDGTNPLYIYGYGSYGSNVEPYFSGSRLSLLDRGFVFAIAHIRGSQTLGRQWYEDGKLQSKRNTFTDFIDATKVLVAEKYGAKDKIFAAGGSAGGLLMGAVINMAPQLYQGVAAHVPFVDVVTTMSDPSIPLTTNEYDEWGNPADKVSYDYMLSYSPYDNVTEQSYPNLLVTTGLNDSQVQYFEPAKWVAKLRELKTDDNVLVFKVNMEAGHGGASGRFRRNKNRALEYAFFMDLIGIKE